MSLSSVLIHGPRWPRALIALLTVEIVAFLAWSAIRPGDELAMVAVADLAFFPPALAAIFVAWRIWRSRTHDPRTRRAWAFVGLACASYGAGAIAWTWFELVLHENPFPSIADIGFLGFYPLMVAALLSFPTAARSRSERIRFWLDLAMIVLAGGTVVWHFVIGPVTAAGGEDPLLAILSVTYPVADLVLLAGMATLVLRDPLGKARIAKTILVLGLVPFFGADLLLGYLSALGTFETGGWSDIGWVVAAYLIAVAGVVEHGAGGDAGERRNVAGRTGVRAQSLIPYGAVVGCYGLLVAVAADQLATSLGTLILASFVMTGLVVSRQITAVRENSRLVAAQAAHATERRFASLIRNSSDLVAILGPDGVLRYVSPSVERLFGRAAGEFIGSSVPVRVHPDDAQVVAAQIAAMTDRGADEPLVAEWRVADRDGEWRYVEAAMTNLTADEDVGGIVINARNVDDRKRLEGELTRQALQDSLTGLANRALYLDRVEHALARRRRSRSSVAALFLDVDDFKRINDGLGHTAGDELLRLIAARIVGALRPGDTAARLGGDEFAVLLENVTLDEAVAIGERITIAVARPADIDGRAVLVTLSSGIALSNNRSSAASLTRDADVAMYTAKGRRKGSIAVFHDAMQRAVLERLETESDLRMALERGELEVHYQPLIELGSGRVEGLEALARWRHPVRGLVPPASFIPVAESTGLIVPLGRWVLETALADLHSWNDGHGASEALRLSVNVSALQLADPRFEADVVDALTRSGVAPALLTLEITEGLLTDAPEITERLHRLKAIGLKLAIDDFGTGYSSLSYLRELPVDAIKIDRAFVTGATDECQIGLTRAIVEIGRALGLETVAEGIETGEQYELLRQLGCDIGQGFLMSRPLDRDGIRSYLRLTRSTEAA